MLFFNRKFKFFTLQKSFPGIVVIAIMTGLMMSAFEAFKAQICHSGFALTGSSFLSCSSVKRALSVRWMDMLPDHPGNDGVFQ